MDAGQGPAGALTTAEKEDLSHLRREVKVLQMEREFSEGLPPSLPRRAREVHAHLRGKLASGRLGSMTSQKRWKPRVAAEDEQVYTPRYNVTPSGIGWVVVYGADRRAIRAGAQELPPDREMRRARQLVDRRGTDGAGYDASCASSGARRDEGLEAREHCEERRPRMHRGAGPG